MSLFDEFESVSYEQWLQKITSDLKGKDFEQSLVWKTDEGFAIQPAYHSELLASNKSSTYNIQHKPASWEIREQINVESPKEANKKALLALKGGANSLQFNGTINSISDLEVLLDGIMLNIITTHFYTEIPENTSNLLKEYLSKQNIDPNNINYFISYDYLGESLVKGSLNEFDITETISINGYNYTNAGANSVQEISYSLSQAIAYIDIASENGKPINETIKSIQFNLGIGTNYFVEIAKFRALKILWKLITKEYGHESLPYIHAHTSSYHLAAQDAATNILRTTTEAMSAIIAGVDSLSIVPFNAMYELPNNFTTRIARNIQLLLQEEAYLNKVADVAKGSYYIEKLTDNIVESALEKFKEIEANGGFIKNINNNTIQDDIELMHQKKFDSYSKNERTLLGVNKHPNPSEQNKISTTSSFKTENQKFKALVAKNLSSELSASLAI